MSLKTQMESDLGVFFNVDEFAQEITYAGEAVNAVVVTDDLTPDLGPDSFQGQIFIKVSALDSEPTYQDAVVIDGENWTVFRDQDDIAYHKSGGVYIINIIKDERPGFF